LFFIEGAVTVAIAFAAMFVLPNFPQTTSWLSEEERQFASWRLKRDIGEDDWTGSADQSLWRGFFLAVKDFKVILIGLLMSMSASSGSVVLFFPTLIQTLNYGTITTLLLTTPPYVLAMFTTMGNAWHADRTGERFAHLAIPFTIAGGMFILAASTTNVAARYTAMMIMLPALFSGHVVAIAWVSNTVARPAGKRAAAFAITNTIANCASIWGSYFYPQSSGPRYSEYAVIVHTES
jgi:Major Facilitator Superfamily